MYEDNNFPPTKCKGRVRMCVKGNPKIFFFVSNFPTWKTRSVACVYKSLQTFFILSFLDWNLKCKQTWIEKYLLMLCLFKNHSSHDNLDFVAFSFHWWCTISYIHMCCRVERRRRIENWEVYDFLLSIYKNNLIFSLHNIVRNKIFFFICFIQRKKIVGSE